MNIGHHIGKWKPPIFGVAQIVLHGVFLASIFLAYVEPKLFVCFRAGKFSSAAPSNGDDKWGVDVGRRTRRP